VSVSDAVDDNAVVTGARVEKVIEGDAGEEAGLRVDDVVVRVGGDPISSSDDLVATVRSYRPGDTVTVAYLRDGDLETAEVVLDSDEGIPTS
jgi:putative serine protease PepD